MIPKPEPNSDVSWDVSSEWDERNPLELEDDCWDAFLPDDGQEDPLPEPGDFWIEFARVLDFLTSAICLA